MLEHDVDVALAGDLPDRLAELARFLEPRVVFGRADLRHLAPALELTAEDDALGAEVAHVLRFALVGDDRDRVRAGGRDKLHTEDTEATGCTPDQHVVAGLERMRRVAV